MRWRLAGSFLFGGLIVATAARATPALQFGFDTSAPSSFGGPATIIADNGTGDDDGTSGTISYTLDAGAGYTGTIMASYTASYTTGGGTLLIALSTDGVNKLDAGAGSIDFYATLTDILPQPARVDGMVTLTKSTMDRADVWYSPADSAFGLDVQLFKLSFPFTSGDSRPGEVETIGTGLGSLTLINRIVFGSGPLGSPATFALTLNGTAVVPEPASLPAFATGLAVLCMMIRRRRPA